MKQSTFISSVAATIAAVGLTISAAAQGSLLLVPDSTNDNIMAFDPVDGSLIDMAFISGGGNLATPVNAIQFGNEILVSDQINDSVFRYSLSDGSFLGTFNNASLDNIRGMAVVDNQVFVTNSGSNNGAPGDSVVVFDSSGNQVDLFDTVGDPFDVLAVETSGGATELYINDIGNEAINIYDTDGNFLRNFHSSDGVTGIDFPQQMFELNSGNILAAGFSSPAGIYEYDLAGNEVNYFDVNTGVRGVYELGNGNIMFTDGNGVYTFDVATGNVTDIVTGVSARFIDLAIIPAPGAFGVLALAGIINTRRRRRNH